MTPSDQTQLDVELQHLHLQYMQSNDRALARKAAEQQRSHLDYLAQLVKGEFTTREMRSIEQGPYSQLIDSTTRAGLPPSEKGAIVRRLAHAGTMRVNAVSLTGARHERTRLRKAIKSQRI